MLLLLLLPPPAAACLAAAAAFLAAASPAAREDGAKTGVASQWDGWIGLGGRWGGDVASGFLMYSSGDKLMPLILVSTRLKRRAMNDLSAPGSGGCVDGAPILLAAVVFEMADDVASTAARRHCDS